MLEGRSTRDGAYVVTPSILGSLRIGNSGSSSYLFVFFGVHPTLSSSSSCSASSATHRRLGDPSMLHTTHRHTHHTLSFVRSKHTRYSPIFSYVHFFLLAPLMPGSNRKEDQLRYLREGRGPHLGESRQEHRRRYHYHRVRQGPRVRSSLHQRFCTTG